MSGKSIVETYSLTKRYSAKSLAVDNLDLVVRQGEVYGFLGPNGAGKTTTLRMLLGLIKPTSGSAELLGEKPGSPAGLGKIGSLVESPAFYPYLSGRDNLRVSARYSSLPLSRVEYVLDQVGLSARAQDKFKDYSLGMKQRLGVARALLKNPELLILDEPTNSLDPKGAVEIQTLIRSLAQEEARTVLLSSHIMAEAEKICDRVGIISKGSLVFEGIVDDLRNREELVIRAEPLGKARRTAESLVGAEQVSIMDNALRLTVSPARAAEINRRMMNAGFEVSELYPLKQSLEEVFLELTQENK